MAASDHAHPPPADTEEALLDVSLRFLVNLPEDEPPSVDRLFFQLQQAHWYYQDFLVDKFDHIDSLQFWEFCKMLFHRNPMLKGYSSRYGQYLRAFKHYVTQIPVYGGILLDKSLKQVLLVRSYRGKSWMFPRGKVNQGEEELDCAVREVEEETSFNMRQHVQSTAHAVEITSGGQKATYFVAVGVPKDYDFAPATRFEVSECRWWKLKDIPSQRGDKGYGRFWSIRRLLQPLKQWVTEVIIGSGATVAIATITKLLESMQALPRLRACSLQKCHLSAPGGRALAVLALHSTSLRVLDLKGSDLGDVGAFALAGALRASTTLVELRLANNGIGCAGICQLAEALKPCNEPHNTSLRFLSLDGNAVGGAAESLAALVRHNTSLERLSLRHQFAPAGRDRIIDALQHNYSLDMLSFVGMEHGGTELLFRNRWFKAQRRRIRRTLGDWRTIINVEKYKRYLRRQQRSLG